MQSLEEWESGARILQSQEWSEVCWRVTVTPSQNPHSRTRSDLEGHGRRQRRRMVWGRQSTTEKQEDILHLLRPRSERSAGEQSSPLEGRES